VLKSRAKEVENFDDSLSRLAAEMLATVRDHEGVGLAANQIGQLKRLLVASVEEEEYVIVNPVLEKISPETEKDTEGCLSLPDVQLEIERPYSVTVSGYTPEGESLELDLEGLVARIIQHELDHLNGILILDRADAESRREAMRQMREKLMAQGS
jgi:peptide deformylase